MNKRHLLLFLMTVSFFQTSLAQAFPFGGGVCVNCVGGMGFGGMPFYNSMGMYPTPSFFPQSYPWWGGYGAMSYSNFGFPGAYMNGGMDGGMYPHGGGGFMGKPNLYISGKPGTDVKVKVRMAETSNWLAAVPVHGDSGWEVSLGEDGKLNSKNKSKFDYLFYDFRFDENHLQDEAGFCSKREETIARIASILKQKHFKAQEIKDFETYWSVKLPPSRGFCVYPQEEKELEKIAKLEIEPQPKNVTRMAFVVVSEEIFALEKKTEKPKKFTKRPTKPWSIEMKPQEPGALEIREWGVGFLRGDSQN